MRRSILLVAALAAGAASRADVSAVFPTDAAPDGGTATVAACPVIPAPASVRSLPGECMLGSAPGYRIERSAGDDACDRCAELAELAAHLESLPMRFAPEGEPCLTLLVGGGADAPASEEGYRLTVSPHGIRIRARSGAGAFYALQTLRQLACDASGGWCVPCIEIDDAPRFPYRGVMLDVSRHFRSVEFVLKQIDALSRYKINRLHLHLTDAAGWRLEVPAYSRLTDYAAWRPEADWQEWRRAGYRYCERTDSGAYGGYYTAADIRRIVEYARRRHIELIPEIEMPGHSEEVTAAYPQLGCEPGAGAAGPAASALRPRADLCPGSEETFRFIEEVLDEVCRLFPSEMIHIGGDEAAKTAWRSCPRCRERMRQEGLQNVEELQSYFIGRVAEMLRMRGRRPIGWDEIADGALATDVAVLSWRGTKPGFDAARRGHDVVMTPGEYCYLDRAQDAPMREPLSFGGYLPLEKVYAFDPAAGASPEALPHLLGVQASLFTEYVLTDDHAEYMLYPRVLAVAETGWSLTENREYASFRIRALGAIDTLRAAGYRTFDLRSEYGQRPESLAPTDHLARGKAATYACAWHPAYPAAGAATLTDGLSGGWSYGDGRWQGFLQTDFDVTVDLGHVVPVHYVGATFLQSAEAEVFLPPAVEIYLSDDGCDYRLLRRIACEAPATYELVLRTFAFEGDAAGRYVRFVARKPGGRGGWLFTDELIVR